MDKKMLCLFAGILGTVGFVSSTIAKEATHSHHSRFLQVSDVLMYLANRYENGVHTKNAWHDKEIGKIWDEAKKHTDYTLDRWPK